MGLHSEVKFVEVVGFSRTDDGDNHRQGATFAFIGVFGPSLIACSQ